MKLVTEKYATTNYENETGFIEKKINNDIIINSGNHSSQKVSSIHISSEKNLYVFMRRKGRK